MPLARLTLAAALLAPAFGLADTVTVVTSFPKELTEAYKKAFEAKNPGIKVEILNKPTPRRRRLHPRSARQQQARRVLGVGAGRLRGAVVGKTAGQNRIAGEGSAGQDRQLPDQRSPGLLPRPGARRLRHHVEHALHEGQQAAGAEGMGRSRQAGLFRPRRHVLARRARAPPTSRSKPSCRAKAGPRAGATC